MGHTKIQQEEYTYRLARDVSIIISSYRERFPDLEWDSIQDAMKMVQASLDISQLGQRDTLEQILSK